MSREECTYVVVIGAANIDIIGRSDNPLIMADSNPGRIELCAGGVSRNICENLARLSVPVRLISALGNDVFGHKITELSESAGIDMSHCFIREGAMTSAYMAILENNGEMKLALADMNILFGMPIEHVAEKREIIGNAALLVLDAGLPEATIEYILDNFGSKKLFLDSVSVGMARHAKKHIGRFDTVKMNLLEAEYLSDLAISDEESLRLAGRKFLEKGIKRVFITMGERGVFYMTAEEERIFCGPPLAPANATGAGDAFMAGIIYCTLNEKDNNYTAKFASSMSRIALMSKYTVCPEMSVENVLKEGETYAGN